MKILQITTYPTKFPRHGGQIRCAQIAYYLQSKGHEVRNIALYTQGAYEEHELGDYDVSMSQNSKYWNWDFPELLDYFSGLAAVGDQDIYSQLKQRYDDFDPDVIILEQPWLFLFAKKVSKSNTKIIYSSHNVEWKLKAESRNKNHEKLSEFINDIQALERQIIKQVDAVISCTESDNNYYKSLKEGDDSKFFVAGNGVEPFSCDEASVRHWLNFFKRPYPAFVGSAHPPNAFGFWDMMEPGLTFLKPNEEVAVIGGVSDIFLQNRESRLPIEYELPRLHILGKREKIELQSMVRGAHFVMLPITSGGGSNLKTAEAIESGRPIVSTSLAFRGYEDVMDYSGIYIADTPAEFRSVMRNLLDSERVDNQVPKNVVSQYYWSNTLAAWGDVITASK